MSRHSDVSTAAIPDHRPPDARWDEDAGSARCSPTTTLTTPLAGTVPTADDPAGRTAAARPWWAQVGTQPLLARSDVRHRSRRAAASRTALLATLVAGTCWVLASSEIRAVEPVAGNGLAHLQSNAALIGGCGPIYTVTDAAARSGIVDELTADGAQNRQGYDTIVPMYGPFWDAPASQEKAFWERTDEDLPLPENLLANAWQGDLVVYYTVAADDEEVEALRTVARDAGDTGVRVDDLRLRVVPWAEERGRLPGGRAFAFVAWNHSQTCHRFMPSALGDFRRFAPAGQAPGHDGTRPPVHPGTTP